LLGNSVVSTATREHAILKRRFLCVPCQNYTTRTSSSVVRSEKLVAEAVESSEKQRKRNAHRTKALPSNG
jgi:hypothetical protein